MFTNYPSSLNRGSLYLVKRRGENQFYDQYLTCIHSSEAPYDFTVTNLCLGLKRYKKGAICRSEISSLATTSGEAGKAYGPTAISVLRLETAVKFTSKETLFQLNLASVSMLGLCSSVTNPQYLKITQWFLWDWQHFPVAIKHSCDDTGLPFQIK